MNIKEALAHIIQELHETHQMTYDEIAGRAGICRSHAFRIAKGTRKTSIDVAHRLLVVAEEFGIHT